MKDEKPIERTAVKSSNVLSAGFCPDRKCIDVQFGTTDKPSAVYRYEDCTQEEFNAILAADKDDKQSVGSHINKYIKPKKFAKL